MRRLGLFGVATAGSGAEGDPEQQPGQRQDNARRHPQLCCVHDGLESGEAQPEIGLGEGDPGVIVDSVPNPTLRTDGQKPSQICGSGSLILLVFSGHRSHGRKL